MVSWGMLIYMCHDTPICHDGPDPCNRISDLILPLLLLSLNTSSSSIPSEPPQNCEVMKNHSQNLRASLMITIPLDVFIVSLITQLEKIGSHTSKRSFVSNLPHISTLVTLPSTFFAQGFALCFVFPCCPLATSFLDQHIKIWINVLPLRFLTATFCATTIPFAVLLSNWICKIITLSYLHLSKRPPDLHLPVLL